MNMTEAFDYLSTTYNQTRKIDLTVLTRLESAIRSKMSSAAVACESSQIVSMTKLHAKLDSTAIVNHAIYSTEQQRSAFRSLLATLDV